MGQMETLKESSTGITKKKMRISGSEAVILSLLEEGVDTVFGYPGGAIMPIYDALYGYKEQLNHYLVRHEQGAAHAAQGYARVTGKVGVCFATSGPGATNLMTGIADAQIDSTPIVCITGQVVAHLLGTDAFQESDILGISMPITKWNFQVTKAEEIPAAIARAFYIAKTGRPGPVLIDITKNAQSAELDFEYTPCKKIRSYHPYPVIQDKDIMDAAKVINNAKKPFLLSGHGVLISGAEKAVLALSEKANIPVASTLLGLSSFPPDHPNYVGYLGMHGNYAPNVLTNECDVLIAIGMRFDDRVTGDVNQYAKKAKVVHIEIDPAEIDKIIKTEVAINADANQALECLLPYINKADHSEWINEFRKLDKIEYDKVIKNDLYPTSDKIKMGEVVRLISEISKGEAIVVTDVGQHQMIANRYYKYKKPNHIVTSGGLGTMGFALPAAMGAQIGKMKEKVISIAGDGGFQMTLQELGTIFQYNIPVKIVVLNNNFLGMVRQWQQLFFKKRYSFTEMTNPDFIKIADGYGIVANRVEQREDLEKALQTMYDHDGPYFLEVKVEMEENVFPMVPSGDSVSNIRLE
ncbi:MAG: biosynthetic-type acetolactate synthase large subunit [Cyclobacteriaceae bacterium]|nr:biosynthetic-type acetolactate synthase large subunit [Cyclobacteriaceae bacterium]